MATASTDDYLVRDVSPGRSTRDVVEDHLRLWQDGDLTTDLLRNFDEDAVCLAGDQVFLGRTGVRQALDHLRQELPDARLHLRSCLTEGDVAMVEWGAVGDQGWVQDGVLSLMVRDGRIHAQTMRYTVHRRPQSHLEWSEGW